MRRPPTIQSVPPLTIMTYTAPIQKGTHATPRPVHEESFICWLPLHAQLRNSLDRWTSPERESMSSEYDGSPDHVTASPFSRVSTPISDFSCPERHTSSPISRSGRHLDASEVHRVSADDYCLDADDIMEPVLRRERLIFCPHKPDAHAISGSPTKQGGQLAKLYERVLQAWNDSHKVDSFCMQPKALITQAHIGRTLRSMETC